jgi:hypothetical protein
VDPDVEERAEVLAGGLLEDRLEVLGGGGRVVVAGEPLPGILLHHAPVPDIEKLSGVVIWSRRPLSNAQGVLAFSWRVR